MKSQLDKKWTEDTASREGQVQRLCGRNEPGSNDKAREVEDRAGSHKALKAEREQLLYLESKAAGG